jgi:hypothetical protein
MTTSCDDDKGAYLDRASDDEEDDDVVGNSTSYERFSGLNSRFLAGA